MLPLYCEILASLISKMAVHAACLPDSFILIFLEVGNALEKPHHYKNECGVLVIIEPLCFIHYAKFFICFFILYLTWSLQVSLLPTLTTSLPNTQYNSPNLNYYHFFLALP